MLQPLFSSPAPGVLNQIFGRQTCEPPQCFLNCRSTCDACMSSSTIFHQISETVNHHLSSASFFYPKINQNPKNASFRAVSDLLHQSPVIGSSWELQKALGHREQTASGAMPLTDSRMPTNLDATKSAAKAAPFDPPTLRDRSFSEPEMDSFRSEFLAHVDRSSKWPNVKCYFPNGKASKLAMSLAHHSTG